MIDTGRNEDLIKFISYETIFFIFTHTFNQSYFCGLYCRGADKSLARPGRKQTNVSVRMAWISFGVLPCRKTNLMTAHISMLLKSRASVTCFRVCFLPGWANDLAASPYYKCVFHIPDKKQTIFHLPDKKQIMYRVTPQVQTPTYI